jgi:hypothetical protein
MGAKTACLKHDIHRHSQITIVVIIETFERQDHETCQIIVPSASNIKNRHQQQTSCSQVWTITQACVKNATVFLEVKCRN